MLTDLKTLMDEAKKRKTAVGAFNVPNLEAIRAVVSAAEELNTPVIIQHAEVHENLISIDEIGPIMLEYAKKAKVPVAVHLDHGASFDICIKAIRLGFTSIMYDASAKSFEDNLKETTEMVKIAHAVDVSVEAELGHIFTSRIGGGEGRADSYSEGSSSDDMYTDPDLAKQFVTATGVDCLAIGFGTVHGIYTTKPKLDLNRITQIKNKIDIPFVMHGGSGVSEEDYRTAIKNGICKINYYTYMSKAGGNAVKSYLENLAETSPVFFDQISLAGQDGMKKNVKEAIKIFMNP